MDIPNAIKSMENIREYWSYKTTEVQATELSIKALKRQISKKVVKRHYRDLDCGELYEEGYTYHCPDCDNEVGAASLTFEEVFWKTNYCCDCGRKLDWD